MRIQLRIHDMALIAIVLAGASLTSAQETATAEPVVEKEVAKQDTTREELFAHFVESMKGIAMVGTFTIDGDTERKEREERYEVRRAVKADKGDYWNIFARMKYGEVDVTLPFPVEVKWAGNTPVITVDELKLPGMGVFDARIVISDGKYAGTWRHGKVGGLMYGHIRKDPKKEPQTGGKEEKSDKAIGR